MKWDKANLFGLRLGWFWYWRPRYWRIANAVIFYWFCFGLSWRMPWTKEAAYMRGRNEGFSEGMREAEHVAKLKAEECGAGEQEGEDMKQKTCTWEQDEWHGHWETECEHIFEFTDGGPLENEMVYCPYCGRKIKEEKP